MSETTQSHCWADHLRADGIPCTCMLPDGHPGDHEWTPDDRITVVFRSRERQSHDETGIREPGRDALAAGVG